MRRRVTFSGAAIGHVALRHSSTSYFGGFEFVGHEFQQGSARKIRNRKYGLEHRLKAFIFAAATRHLIDLQELVVRGFLHLNEIGHRRDIADRSEMICGPFCDR
jgi:hypothetical protein